MVGSLDDGHRVVLVLLIGGDPPSKDEERILISVEPLDLRYWQAVTVSCICRTVEKERCECECVSRE